MKTETFAELRGNGKVQPVFERLKVEAELRETLAITTITQTYRNPGSKNIEAVYTFPLPLDAVLLEMEVTLGEKTLKGTVLAKKKAEQRYEDAITDGDAPVMLQNPQPGVYTMNVGNLLPGEKAGIMFRYAMFQRWQGDTLRYHLPTTIAPRYGSAAKAGFEAHQEPESSILVDNFFEFNMVVTGEMAGRLIESPSHEIAIKHETESRKCVISLARKTGFMDRDLIITVRNPEAQAASAMLCMDGEEYLLWGSFRPRFGLSNDITPRSVKIVVDCSGSMAGDSIAQAREALLRILDELRPQDWFNIVTFGSTATPLFDSQKKADQQTLSYARGYLKNMDADMGGTETGSALDMAVRLRCPEKLQQDVLLITDGEIWEWEKVVAKAAGSKHRFFTVGVGSAVSEAFVRTLADRTGGACELVSPDENMAERIHRHFKRIASPRSSCAKVIWPDKPLKVFPEKLPNIYDGDTVNLFAWFSKPSAGEVKLQVTLPDGSGQSVESNIELLTEKSVADETIPRMAAASRLRGISEEMAGQELAVRYQLVSRWTNYLAVVVRDKEGKADTLPELQKVQQMQAAGWGGGGSIMYSVKQSCLSLDRPSFMRDRSSSANVSRVRPTVSFIEDDEDQYDVPTFLRKSVDNSASSCLPACSPTPAQESLRMIDTEPFDSLESVVEYLNVLLAPGIPPQTLQELRLPEYLLSIVDELESEFSDETELVVCFLHYLMAIPVGSFLTRQAKRVISKAYKDLRLDTSVRHELEARLKADLDRLLIEDFKAETSECTEDQDFEERVCSFNFNEEVDRFFDDSSLAVVSEPVAVIIMGGVAAGKTTLRRQNYSQGYVLIDAPDIFISLSQGDYLPFPGPIEEPMNMVGQYVVNRAIRERRNIVTEVIGADVDAMKGLIDSLAGIGYKVNLMHVDCSVESAIGRNENRSEDNISAHYAEKFHLEWILTACMEASTEKADCGVPMISALDGGLLQDKSVQKKDLPQQVEPILKEGALILKDHVTWFCGEPIVVLKIKEGVKEIFQFGYKLSKFEELGVTEEEIKHAIRMFIEDKDERPNLNDEIEYYAFMHLDKPE